VTCSTNEHSVIIAWVLLVLASSKYLSCSRWLARSCFRLSRVSIQHFLASLNSVCMGESRAATRFHVPHPAYHRVMILVDCESISSHRPLSPPSQRTLFPPTPKLPHQVPSYSQLLGHRLPNFPRKLYSS